MEIGTLTTLLLGYKPAERLDDVLYHKISYISNYI